MHGCVTPALGDPVSLACAGTCTHVLYPDTDRYKHIHNGKKSLKKKSLKKKSEPAMMAGLTITPLGRERQDKTRKKDIGLPGQSV